MTTTTATCLCTLRFHRARPVPTASGPSTGASRSADNEAFKRTGLAVRDRVVNIYGPGGYESIAPDDSTAASA